MCNANIVLFGELLRCGSFVWSNEHKEDITFMMPEARSKLIFDGSRVKLHRAEYRKSDTGTTDNLVNFQNKTPCTDGVLLHQSHNRQKSDQQELVR